MKKILILMLLSLMGCGKSDVVADPKNDFVLMYDAQIYDGGQPIRRYSDCTYVTHYGETDVFILYSKSKGRIEASGTVIVEPYWFSVELEKNKE